jgi:hypothetical protein
VPTPPALRGFNPTFVRFGSKADFAPCLDFVRFTRESGQWSHSRRRRLAAAASAALAFRAAPTAELATI